MYTVLGAKESVLTSRWPESSLRESVAGSPTVNWMKRNEEGKVSGDIEGNKMFWRVIACDKFKRL
jgi:hypothetical protein